MFRPVNLAEATSLRFDTDLRSLNELLLFCNLLCLFLVAADYHLNVLLFVRTVLVLRNWCKLKEVNRTSEEQPVLPIRVNLKVKSQVISTVTA